MKKIAYLGIPGSYSYIAANKYFGKEIKMKSCNNIKDVFNQVESCETNFGIVPLENSSTGSLLETYDHLVNSRLSITGEIILKIHLHLLVCRGTKTIKKVKLHGLTPMASSLAGFSNGAKPCTECHSSPLLRTGHSGTWINIYSHPQAFMQCKDFLFDKHLSSHFYSTDTASAAMLVARHQRRNEAAIASKTAAEIYGLIPLYRNIEDIRSNFTRFVILKRKNIQTGSKISLAFSISHAPGSLYKALEPYALNNLNLSKIESRPIFGKPWEYIFFLDFEIDNPEFNLESFLSNIKEHTNFMKFLGRYDKGEMYES